MQEVYAELVLCVQSSVGDRMCLIRPMGLLLSSQGQQMYNEYDCPLLHAEMKVTVVPAESVLSTVSIVHECSRSFVFSFQSCQRTIERQSIDCDDLVYQHDFSNNLFCLNVFCMSRNFRHV